MIVQNWVTNPCCPSLCSNEYKSHWLYLNWSSFNRISLAGHFDIGIPHVKEIPQETHWWQVFRRRNNDPIGQPWCPCCCSHNSGPQAGVVTSSWQWGPTSLHGSLGSIQSLYWSAFCFRQAIAELMQSDSGCSTRGQRNKGCMATHSDVQSTQCTRSHLHFVHTIKHNDRVLVRLRFSISQSHDKEATSILGCFIF